MRPASQPFDCPPSRCCCTSCVQCLKQRSWSSCCSAAAAAAAAAMCGMHVPQGHSSDMTPMPSCVPHLGRHQEGQRVPVQGRFCRLRHAAARRGGCDDLDTYLLKLRCLQRTKTSSFRPGGCCRLLRSRQLICLAMNTLISRWSGRRFVNCTSPEPIGPHFFSPK